MEKWLLLMLMLVLFLLLRLFSFYRRRRNRHRQRVIENYRFPARIASRLKETYPHLNAEEIALVEQGLREYFQICNAAGRRMVAMPSQVVDVAWHEFIVFTRNYRTFCLRALGRFLHHTPAEAMQSPTLAQAGIKRAWKYACLREGISSRTPSRLPLIFALDEQLNIPDGFRYRLDCRRGVDGYCAGHIGCSAGDSGCGGDSSGCGGGCGGGD